MHSEVKTWERNDQVFSNKGNVKRGEYVEIDCSDFRVVHTGVDTFKQLFRGTCNVSVLSLIALHYENMPDVPICFGDYEFKVSKSSSMAGFQWLLKNMNQGIVVLFKSFYDELDVLGTHLKIEYSPNLLLASDPVEVDQISIDIANMFLVEYQFSDVAVHIACDFKGYDIPDNLEKNLRTRAKRNYSYSGLESVEFDLKQAVARYGTNESYTFGSPGSIQMCLYDKSKEADKRDKLSFWIQQWSKTPSVEDCFEPEYKQDDRIVRLEARFHHSVIRQFTRGTKAFEATNFAQLCHHLTGLFRYFLDNFRLHYNKNFIHPIWQILMEDIEILSPSRPLMYQRSYKSESGSSRRNVAFWIGNAMRLFVRQQFNVDFIVKYFLDSCLIKELREYLKLDPRVSMSELSMCLHEFVRQKHKSLTLDGVSV